MKQLLVIITLLFSTAAQAAGGGTVGVVVKETNNLGIEGLGTKVVWVRTTASKSEIAQIEAELQYAIDAVKSNQKAVYNMREIIASSSVDGYKTLVDVGINSLDADSINTIANIAINSAYKGDFAIFANKSQRAELLRQAKQALGGKAKDVTFKLRDPDLFSKTVGVYWMPQHPGNL